MYFPLLSLIVLYVTIEIFQQNDWVFGIVAEARSFFWLLTAYMVFITVSYALFSKQTMRPYYQRILNPLFILLVGGRIITNVLNLNQLGEIEVLQISETVITVGTLFWSVIVFYVFITISGVMQDVLGTIILPRSNADVGTSNAILTITRYTLIIVGFGASLAALGFNLSSLALIGGGLSIGIGFGLQQVISNFISGLLLLFEQSLRPGDIIDVDGKLGQVEKLSIRATTIRTLENVDVIIPNETFLTSSVKTYTRSGQVVRSEVRVGVSYGSDPVEVRRLLKEVVNNHGMVLKDPEAQVFFVDFGESSLDFLIFFWIENPLLRYPVGTDLRMMIWKAFQKNGIEIPFPQRDLHVRSGLEVFQNQPTMDFTTTVETQTFKIQENKEES